MYYPVIYLLYRIKACLAALLHRWTRRLTPNQSLRYHGRRKPIPDTRSPGVRLLNTPKPSWVREELFLMKAQMPEASSRFLAATFNRRFRVARQMTVGKTYVAEMLKQHTYEIQILSTDLKRRPPRLVPLHLIWGMDLTGKTDRDGNTHSLLGIVEHASRANLSLTALKDKTIQLPAGAVHWCDPPLWQTPNHPHRQ
jgi:hypothetical protein